MLFLCVCVCVWGGGGGGGGCGGCLFAFFATCAMNIYSAQSLHPHNLIGVLSERVFRLANFWERY